MALSIFTVACGPTPVSPATQFDGGVSDVRADDPGDGMERTSCDHPSTQCGSTCVDTRTNPLHCGGCNQPCPGGSLCQDGECAGSCSYPNTACGDSCVNLREDPNHCGQCGNECPSSQSCVDGRCACAPHLRDCHGECVNSDEDDSNCGLCGRVCEDDETCNRGHCVCAEGDTEICNDGRDNDCDELVDCMDPDCTGQTRSCINPCDQEDQQTCLDTGEWSECSPDCADICEPHTEICGDGIDQDCDGSDSRQPDGYEPNDSCEECALVNGMADTERMVAGSFDSVNDSFDCYRFTVEDSWDLLAAESAEAELTGIPPGHNYDLYIYRSMSDCIDNDYAQRSTRGGNYDEEVDIWEATNVDDTGEYFVVVRRVEGYTCQGNTTYELRFDGLSVF